jgi:tetratricopeptide (TPR) repeat protein
MSEPARATVVPGAAPRGPVEEFRAQLAQLIEENEGFRNQLTELSETLSTAVTTHRSGDLAHAEAGYRGILTKLPNHPHALHMLGVIELQRGNVQSAIDLIRRAIGVHPGHPEPWINLGNALRAIQENDEAISAYQRAITLKPDMVLAHTELSRLLMDLGRYEAAISYCEAAVAINPGSMPARVQLAIALRCAGRLKDSARHWSEIIALAPNRAESYYVLGMQFRDIGQLPEALRCHNMALALKPDIPEFLCAKGGTLIYLNRADEALECFRRAETVSPGMKDALAGIGWALRSLGRFEEADRYFHKVRAIDPGDPRSYKHVSSEGKALEANEEQNLAAVLERRDTTADARITAGFGLGRLLDKARRYDEAFARYATANALVRDIWPKMGDLFDADRFTARIEGLIERYQDQSSLEPADFSNMSELPVFIVGMPRSGTTLVEQICASHSRVFGAGELGDIIRLDNILNRPDVAGSPVKLRETARRLAKEHIVKLYGQANGALRVVDKMPDNILLVGLIARLFPRARIIWCSRDNRDTALSCYFQMFAPGAQHFSYDLADCGHRTRLVGRLGRHWMTLMPNRMIEVNYEALIDDLEGQSRRLIEFLGLAWEPACMDFHRTERPVATVSYWQVRQPLYHSSVGRWRNYEKHLGPLFSALSTHE